MKLVWWSLMSLLVVMLIMCLGGAKRKEVVAEEQQQQGGVDTNSLVRSRIRNITNLITSIMRRFMSRSNHAEPDSGLKDIIEEEFMNDIVEVSHSSIDEERERTSTQGKERLEDSPITEGTPSTMKNNLLGETLPSKASDVLIKALPDVEASPEPKGVINSEKRYLSTAGEVLNDHHHDVSADPALPTCSKDDTFGSCSGDGDGFASRPIVSLGPLPVTIELSDDAEMEMEISPVSVDSSKGKTSGVKIGDVNGGAEVISDELFNTDTAGDSEEAFNSISIDYEAQLSDSTRDENTDSDSEGDFFEGEDEYETDDDRMFNLSDYYSELSDMDDSIDGEMLYVNEAELSDLQYVSRSNKYDSDISSDEDDNSPDQGIDVEGEVEVEAKV